MREREVRIVICGDKKRRKLIKNGEEREREREREGGRRVQCER